MNEVLHCLGPGAVVLDIGSGRGSFEVVQPSLTVIRTDLEHDSGAGDNFVQSDAARLPFLDHCFDAVVSNHSLEHFENLRHALEEIGRVAKPNGILYVAVPDATTITDRLYRWLARGGGHVNPFTSATELAAVIERATGLRHAATRTLCTSLSFLNRRNHKTRPPMRLWLLGGGTHASLLLLTYMFRLFDRVVGSRTSVYGWALYFGNIGPVDCTAWTNVCVGCGAGHASERLLGDGRVARLSYRCPGCGTLNLFTDDKNYQPRMNPDEHG